MKRTEQLFNMIPKLDTVQFIGLARLLGVKLVKKGEPNPGNPKITVASRPFVDVLEDMMRAFEKLNRKRQREIIQLVKAAIKPDGDD